MLLKTKCNKKAHHTFKLVEKAGIGFENDGEALAKERIDGTKMQRKLGARGELLRVNVVPAEGNALEELVRVEPQEKVRKLLVELIFLLAT